MRDPAIARLWLARLGGTRADVSTPPPQLFSPRRRKAQGARWAKAIGHDFIAEMMAESIADRLAMVTRRFERALLIAPSGHPLERRLSGLVSDPTQIAEVGAIDAHGVFDLILWPGGLEAIDDVPGALVRTRQCLSADGMLMGAMVGDGSFPLLRRLLVSDGVRPIARMHPQIDLKSLGNLLQRAGFTLPVTDVEANVLRYRDWRDLARDLRHAGLSGQLAAAPPPLSRAELAALDRAFIQMCGPDGRADEQLRLVFFTGWSPHPGQPRAAPRGSGTASLAAALRAPVRKE